jgi:hypothetical protein
MSTPSSPLAPGLPTGYDANTGTVAPNSAAPPTVPAAPAAPRAANPPSTGGASGSWTPAAPGIPMIDNNGKPVYVPAENAQKAISQGGYKLSVDMIDPQGSKVAVPFDQQDRAQKEGKYTWDDTPANDALKTFLPAPTPDFNLKAALFGPTTNMGGADPVYHNLAVSNIHDRDVAAAQRPLVDVSQFIDKQTHPVAKALAEDAQSMLTPESIATMVSLGGLALVKNSALINMASSLVASGFSALQITAAYKHFESFRDAYDSGDKAEARYQLTHAVASGTLAAVAGTVAVRGIVNPWADARAAAKASKAAGSDADAPGIVTQLIQGQKVAQPGAQQAVRTGVQAATENAGTADESVAANIQNQPLLSRNQTVVDEHLSGLRGLEQDAYDHMDDAAGFDVKAEKLQLANDQYKLKQLGNTDADIALKEKLNASISDSQARISDAESKMRDANIDPKAADVLHKQRMAGIDFKKALVQNTSADGQTVNVDGLLNASKKLRFTKYGDRLSQFFGSDKAADDFMSNLQQAQKTGVQAVQTRKNALWIAGALGVSGVGAKIIHGAVSAAE